MSPELERKTAELRRLLAGLQPGLVAVSGGLDSRLLFHLCVRWRLDFTPLFFDGGHLTPRERASALEWLSERHADPLVVEVEPLSKPEVRANQPERCYHCKGGLFSLARKEAERLGLKHVLDGTNASDLGEHRPGLRALRELGVRSPLAEAGIGKPEVRELALEFGLDRPDQPSRACLLTRFAYGLESDREMLSRLGEAEDALTALGLNDFRLRVPAPGRFTLQIAAPEKELAVERESEILDALDGLSLTPVEMLFADRVSGFYDR